MACVLRAAFVCCGEVEMIRRRGGDFLCASGVIGAALVVLGSVLACLRRVGVVDPALVERDWRLFLVSSGAQAAIVIGAATAVLLAGLSTAMLVIGPRVGATPRLRVMLTGWMRSIFAGLFAGVAVVAGFAWSPGAVAAGSAFAVALWGLFGTHEPWPRQAVATATGVFAAAGTCWLVLLGAARVSWWWGFPLAVAGIGVLSVVTVVCADRHDEVGDSPQPKRRRPVCLATSALAVGIAATIVVGWSSRVVVIEELPAVTALLNRAVPQAQSLVQIAMGPDGTAFDVEVHGYGGPRESTPKPDVYHCDANVCTRVEGPRTDLAIRHGAVGVTPNGFAIALDDDRMIDVFACSPTQCGTAAHVDIQQQSGIFHRPTVTGRADGTLVIAYSSDRLLRVVTVEHPGTDPTVTTSTLNDAPLIDPGSPSVAVTADGRPVLATGDGRDGSIWLSICRDRLCGSATHHRLVGQGTYHPAPAVVVDADDIPLVADVSADGAQLVVYACDDVDCGSPTPRPISWRGGALTAIRLHLDAGQRPVMTTWAGGYDKPFTPLSTLRCIQKRCGA